MIPNLVIFDCDGVIVDSEPPLLDFLRNEYATMAVARYIGTLTLDTGYTLNAR